MEVDELKTKSTQQLHEILSEYREKLRQLRFKASEGALKENHKIEEARKTIARILTLLNEENNQ
ncbi:MAG: 50S ribosomal protein L29 [Candidatus Magasanikbacteria bacterium]